MPPEETHDQPADDIQDDNTKTEPERRFTQDDLERYVAKTHKNLRRELESRPTQDQLMELQEKYNQLIEEKELEGKTGHEKLKHQYQKELEKLSAKINQYDEQMKSKDQAVAEAQALLEKEKETLRTERLGRAFSAALQKAEVIPVASDAALTILLSKLRDTEIDERGIRASYGKELIEESPEKIAKRFLQDHPFFTSVKGGGAGTTLPNGQPMPKNLHDLTLEELDQLAGSFPK